MSTRPDRDRGFTLIEFVLATMLSGIVAGVLIAALATSLHVARSTTNQIADSTDTALISTFLFRDAQAAGATDPSTARVDAALGVSTTNASSGWAGCEQGENAQLVVRFSWIDRQADSHNPSVVTYALDDGHLTRRACQGVAGAEDRTSVDVVLGNNIAEAAAACAPSSASDTSPDTSCGELAETVSLTFRGSASTNPSEYTLTASLRPGAQQLPTIEESPLVPLVALGGADGTTSCVNLSGNSAVAVVGDAAVAADCDEAPDGSTPGNLFHPLDLGATRILTGLTNPFAHLVAPRTSCDAGGVTHADDVPVTAVYPDPVVISNPVELAPGTHVFCDGLEIQGGATVTGTDTGVFLFILGGTLTVDPAATVSLTAPVAGAYENMLVWVASAQQVTVGGNAITGYHGQIYAPTSDLVVAGSAPTMIGGAVARSVKFSGDGPVRLGLPVPEITVAPTNVPSGQVGLAYPPTTLSADGGQPSYTWSASGLPPGIDLDAESGVLSSGVVLSEATEPRTYDVVVTALDATLAATSVHINVEIVAALSIAGPTELPDGQVAVPFPTTLLESEGGTGPFTWTSTELPEGLELDPASGVLSGTPTVAGSFPVTFTVTDAMSATVSTDHTLVVREQLTVATPTLPGGQVGVAYPSIALNAAGGTPPMTWSAAGLPPGLEVSPAGALTGTPTTPGTFNIVVQVTDAISAEATTAFTVTIAPRLGVGTTTLPGGQVGVAYPATAILATGGTPPFVWSATGLPAGLTIDSGTGTVAGTPTVAGTSTVAAEVTDANGATSAASYSIVIDAALTIAGPETLPTGQVGLAFPSTPVSSSGGTTSYTWSATGLPPGLTISSATGVISGSPTSAGTFKVVVSVTDALSVVASRPYDLIVVAQLAIATAVLPDGTVGVSYPPTTVVAEGGQGPGTWSASGLPTGLTIGTTTGIIAGTPQALGTSTVVIAITDAAGATATRSFSVTVTSPVSACPVAPTGWRGEYFGNLSLTGDPKICRDDPSINFNWGTGSPGTGIAADDFSARWTRTQNFAAGTYTFAIGSDDGSRLYIDGVLVFDRWVDQGYPGTVPTVSRTLTGGDHVIVMEYYERGGSARATLTWTFAPPPDPCAAAFAGWKGEYFSNATLTGPATMCRSDASIDFNWGSGSPSTGIPADRFSVRWTRVVNLTAGTYTFALGSDNGSRLYIDGVLALDQWATQPYTVSTVDTSLAAGSHTIVVEYYEDTGSARATLDWTQKANGVTATPSVSGNQRTSGEHRITLTNTSMITAMTVTIVVDRTVGLSYSGMSTTDFPGAALTLDLDSGSAAITYTFDLISNRKVPAGTRTLVAKTSGTGTLHPTTGDTWTVVTTSNDITNTLTGTF